MKEYIGGFLEFETFNPPERIYHRNALALSNARACISHIIRQTCMRKVWLPYYTCNALLEPFDLANVTYQFYSLTKELTIANIPQKLEDSEYLVYINYFGLKKSYAHHLSNIYGDKLLTDNTQDFFSREQTSGWAFNSARKSFGVPDGGYLYGPVEQLGTADNYPVNTDYHAGYLIDRLRGAQKLAYDGFVAYERTLSSEQLRISELSASVLSQIDYTAVIERRRENFQYYHHHLGDLNTLPINLQLGELPDDTVPFCYPFLPVGGELLERRMFFERKLFIPTLWPDILTRQPAGYTWERYITQALLPLPIDHRYGPAEAERVIAVTRELLTALSVIKTTSIHG